MKIDRDQLAAGQMVHGLIAKTAKEITEAVFEACSYSDPFHAAWPEKKCRAFVKRFWPDYIGYARQSLAMMLTPIAGTENDPDGPKFHYPESMRNEVYEALLIDGQYKRPPPKSTEQLRAEAGFEPISEVLKARHGQVLH